MLYLGVPVFILWKLLRQLLELGLQFILAFHLPDVHPMNDVPNHLFKLYMIVIKLGALVLLKILMLQSLF